MGMFDKLLGGGLLGGALIGGGLGSSLTNFFSGGKEKGYEQMAETMGQGMQDMRANVEKGNSYLNPFYQNGLGQGSVITNAISRLMNPQEFNKQMMAGYSMSPQAQHQIAIGNDAATNAALASGMAGSTPHMSEINEQSQAIAGRDMQQYLDNMMRNYGLGLNTSQGMYGQGMGAGGQMASGWTGLNNALAKMYEAQAKAQEKQSEASSGGLSNLLSAGMGLAGFL